MDLRTIPLDSVRPSQMNPRKTFDEDAVKELAANIEKQGLIQPITVRTYKVQQRSFDPKRDKSVSTNDGYEIVCGERRYRAFRLLKEKEDTQNVERVAAHRKKSDRFQEIPAIIREMSDEEAFEAMITENLQRQDVDPMEEAFAFGQLLKNGKTAEEIALKFGKSIRFVQDRVKLNTLIPELMLAVKEDKMSIAAAMIVCKLDADMQKKYYSQYCNNYQGLSKATAESFVNNLFMTLSHSPWFKSDNQADEDFEGGCGRACSVCQFNTTNHGCLFWEMKTQDAGRCTDRARFQSKVLAYMLKELDVYSESLVKAGEPIEKGKTVIGFPDEYSSDSAKDIKDAFKTEVESRGYEIVDLSSVFDGRCWYGANDERTIEKLKSGELYRVLIVKGYDIPYIEEAFYHVKSSSTSVNTENGLPMTVANLLRDYNNLNNGISATKTVNGCKAIGDHGKFQELKELDNTELVLAYSLMIKNNQELCMEFGLGNFPSHDEIRQFVVDNIDKAPYILRAWVKHALRYGTSIVTLDEARHIAMPFIDHIGELWCRSRIP